MMLVGVLLTRNIPGLNTSIRCYQYFSIQEDFNVADISSHENLCFCGSGKPYSQCCGHSAVVIHFSRGKRNRYGSIIENAVGEIIDYAKQYFYNWESAALSRFTSYAQDNHISDEFMRTFYEWFVMDFRFHQDVSTIIDFYLAENDGKFNDTQRQIIQAIRNSYLSLYRILWIKNNALAVRDILTGREFNIEKNLGSLNRVIHEGMLLLGRMVTVGHTSLLMRRPQAVLSGNRQYLCEEINSIRLQEGINDPAVFQKEFAEVACGLIMDLMQGIKKNRLKTRSIAFSQQENEKLAGSILSHHEFALLEEHEKWLKFTWNNKNASFTRLYLGSGSLLAAADDLSDLISIVQKIDLIWESITDNETGEWKEGCCFPSEQEAEEVLVDVMHDKYFEEWINTPHLELEDLTPLQAIKDVKGRVLLENLLSDLEDMELRAKSKDEYYFPTSVIRTRLSLNREEISRELLQPEAIALQVNRHRIMQELSPYVTVYNWINEEIRTVAAAAYDYYSKNEDDRKKLAWVLFMWNEFSKIYRPKVYMINAWLAALEYSYLFFKGEKFGYAQVARKFKVSTLLLSKKAQLIIRHFGDVPLQLDTDLAAYPYWSELGNRERINVYEEVKQLLKIFTYTVKENWGQEEQQIHNDFYNNINTSGKFWQGSTSSIYHEFYTQYYELDCLNSASSTIANLFWENQAKRFPPSLKTAAFNLMTSYVGAYRIIPAGRNELIFEDYFTGKRYEMFGNFGTNAHKNIVPGMLVITRLLPLGGEMWVTEPMFIVLPDMLDLFEKNYQMLMERYNPYDITDVVYLKIRGKKILKANIMAIDDTEQNTVSMMNQPLQMEWQAANLMHGEKVSGLLGKCSKFRCLHQDQERASFLWICNNSAMNYQWGYLLIKSGTMLISAPPAKELDRFIKDIRRAVKSADIVVAFRPFKARVKILKEIEQLFIEDLALFFNKNSDLSLKLLRQDNLPDDNQEWSQGIFLLKLGTLLMDYLHESNKPTR